MSKGGNKKLLQNDEACIEEEKLIFTVNRVEKAMDLNSGQSINTKYASGNISE